MLNLVRSLFYSNGEYDTSLNSDNNGLISNPFLTLYDMIIKDNQIDNATVDNITNDSIIKDIYNNSFLDKVNYIREGIEDFATNIIHKNEETTSTSSSSTTSSTTTKNNLLPNLDNDIQEKLEIFANEIIERSDPRMVPSSIYDLKCKPGLYFHACVKECLDNRPNEIKSMKEANNFNLCVEECRHLYLLNPIPGCMDHYGDIIPGEYNLDDNITDMNTITLHMRSLMFKLHKYGSITKYVLKHIDIISLITLAVILFLIYCFNIHIALYALINGPTSQTLFNKNLNWILVEKAEKYHYYSTNLWERIQNVLLYNLI